MSRLSMTLGDWDCTSAFNKWGASFQYIKVEGQNSGISMGGSLIVDLIRAKDCWILPGNAVNSTTYAKLLACTRQDYIQATYPHPETGEFVTKTMIPTLAPATRTPIRAGEVWYEGWSLTLEER